MLEPIFVERETFEKASSEAGAEATQEGGRSLTGVMYRQGNRYMVSAVITMNQVADLITGEDKDLDDDERANRRLIPDHKREIVRYLGTAGETYILPPLSLNLRTRPVIYTTQSQSVTKPVVIILPNGFQFQVADGLHRTEAIREMVNGKKQTRDGFGRDSICINIVLEDDIDQSRQDFADCAKTRKLSSSLLSEYDMRMPLHTLTNRIISGVPFFKGRIETANQTVGKTGLKIFTRNQLRYCTGEIITGKGGLSATSLETIIPEYLGKLGGDEYMEKVVGFFNTFTECNEVWSSIATGEKEMAIPELRDQYVHLKATGLSTISRLGWKILQQAPEKRGDFVEKLAAVDWKRNAPFWRELGVVNTTHAVVSGQPPIRAAVKYLEEEIGLSNDNQRRLPINESEEGFTSEEDFTLEDFILEDTTDANE